MNNNQKGNTIYRLEIPSILIMLIFIINNSYSKNTTIISSGAYIWFATKHGLIRYNNNQNEWNTFSIKNGLVGNNIKSIGIEEGIIWVVTDQGISNADIRFNDWRSYSDDVLPSKNISCITFSDDYVWIGTDKGLVRYDKLLEEWKVYTTSDGLSANTINDIAIMGDSAWISTSEGISRLEISFDKWSKVDIKLPSNNITRSIITGDFIWFFTDSGLIRYDKKLASWKTYRKSDGIISYLINDVITKNNDIWLLTQEGIGIYDSSSDSWSEGMIYHTMLPSRNIAGMALASDMIWFATDKGVSVYDSKNGSWRHFTANDVLLDSSCKNVFVGNFAFVVSENGINIYDRKTQDWDNYKFQESDDQKGIRNESGFRIDEKGLGFDISKDNQIRLSGTGSMEFNDIGKIKPKRQNEYNWQTQNDVALKGSMPDNRTLAGFYNDLNKDNIDYGLTYKGNEKDLFYKADAGKFNANMRNSELIDELYLLGIGSDLRHRFGDIGLNFETRFAEQIGHFDTDFFVYKTGTITYQLKNTNIIPETEIIIADMETLQRGVDYIMIYTNGLLVFPNEELIEDGEIIEIKYQYKPESEAKKQQIGLMTLGLDVGNNHYMGLDALYTDNLGILSLNEESKNIKLGSLSMKIRPEIAYSQNTEESGLAGKTEVLATLPKTQLKIDYAEYSSGFQTTSKPQNRFGEIERSIKAFSNFDIKQWFPLSFKFQNEKANSDSDTFNENNAKINLGISKEYYPIIALTGKGSIADNNSGEEQRQTSARTDFQYDFPQLLLSHIGIKKLELSSYYNLSDQSSEFMSNNSKIKNRTRYFRLKLDPIERFNISASYKQNSSFSRDINEKYYNLNDERNRLIIKSSFASLKGAISDFYFDNTKTNKRSENDISINNKNTYLATGLNLIPGMWLERLRMLTFLGRYSFLQQTAPISNNGQIINNDFRAIRLQFSLTPFNSFMTIYVYNGIKSWAKDFSPVKYEHRHRAESEIRPNTKSRIVFEYDQKNEAGSNTQKNSYSPSIFYETKLSQRWSAKIRNVYNLYRIEGLASENGSMLTPSITFRYINNEMSNRRKIYVTQTSSVSIDSYQKEKSSYSSKSYATSLITEWKFIRNMSLQFRVGVSYKDNHQKGKTDEMLANAYLRMTARF